MTLVSFLINQFCEITLDVKKHKGIVLEGPWAKKTLLNLTKKNMSKKVHPLVLPSLEKSITKELEN
jgi:hypothetical protein